MEHPREEVSRFLTKLTSGEDDAIEELYAIVYDDLRKQAVHIMNRERRGHTLQPTALVNEAYLRLIGQTQLRWNDRAHFLAIVAQAMRRVLVDHARTRRRVKRGGDNQQFSLNSDLDQPTESGLDVIEIDDSIRRLATLDERKGRVAELKIFASMTFKEMAEALGVSPKTVEADWYLARAWLRNELR